MASTYPAELTARVRDEVVEVHDVIEAWIRGALDDTDPIWEDRFAWRFTADFRLVSPGGSCSPPGTAVDGVRAMHGTNPDFRITTSDWEVVRAGGGLVVARYIEWQRHARHAVTEENGRWSTVVFEDDGTALRWAWLHETWLDQATLGRLADHV